MIVVETFGAEDLDIGVSTTLKTLAGGGQITIHRLNLASLGLAGAAGTATTATWNPGAVAAGGAVSTTVTVAGAVLGDKVLVSFDMIGSNALLLSAHVQAADTVRVVIGNLTGSPVTLASGTLSVLVFHHN